MQEDRRTCQEGANQRRVNDWLDNGRRPGWLLHQKDLFESSTIMTVSTRLQFVSFPLLY